MTSKEDKAILQESWRFDKVMGSIYSIRNMVKTLVEKVIDLSEYLQDVLNNYAWSDEACEYIERLKYKALFEFFEYLGIIYERTYVIEDHMKEISKKMTKGGDKR